MPPHQTCSYKHCLKRLNRTVGKYKYGTGFVCRRCYQKNQNDMVQEENVNVDFIPATSISRPIDDEDNSSSTLVPESQSTPHLEGFLYLKALERTEHSCCVCHNSTGSNRISEALLTQVWAQLNIVLPVGNIICDCHFDLDSGLLNENALCNIRQIATAKRVPQNDVMHLISGLTKENKAATSRKLHFETENLQDDQYNVVTGVDRAAFEHLELLCRPDVKKFRSSSTRNSICIFLMWLKLGLSQEALSVFFGISQPTISRILECVRKSLICRFVPTYLGYDHISRQEFIDRHSTEFGKLLCYAGPDTAVAIADGTYIYIEKSSNYSFQKMTYSVQKKRNLVKPMIVASLTGYILQAEGPYYANGANNDASIMNNMLMDAEGFSSFFKEGDCLILDRGFRDSITLAQNLGLSVKSPHFLPKGDRQLSTEQANSSRVTTIMRWVIEAVNARIKKFKLLKNTVPNKYVPVIGELVQIVCAIQNAYFPAIAVDKPEHAEMAVRILEEIDRRNELQETILSTGLHRLRNPWARVNNFDIPEFPVLTLEDLHHLTLGVYQVKQAQSYTAEHLKNGQYELWCQKDNPTLLRVKVESRHTSTAHQLWIEFKPNTVGFSGIKGWFCECKVGARVIGMCAHITSVLWYLGVACHHSELRFPAESIDRNMMDASTTEHDE